MKVSVYKEDGGTVSVLVEAAPGNKKPPVLLQKVALGKIGEVLPPVLDYQAGPKEAAPG